ncbi:hypothetical protein CDO73_01345 [Saccharibacillus sp. O23]|uniref:amino acid adenylation domain-containing protein n=1 Tax=Saccharibacillus sp. O23 TaxID=2009338 RepID=UPI000B4E3642|nr:amino acid adenylation domain-containing protein [Saccharibacillus sp. O23]OWR33178.1 hypothetical protein CDO73_01345 [Saccharibacillus sp. O23]
MTGPAETKRAIRGPEREAAEWTIPGRFEAAAARHAARIAVVDESGSWTYDQLRQASARAAANIRRLVPGTGGERIALLTGRTKECVAAMLGALEAGHAYLCIDPLYPAERIAYMLSDAQVGLLVHDGTYALPLPGECRAAHIEELTANLPPIRGAKDSVGEPGPPFAVERSAGDESDAEAGSASGAAEQPDASVAQKATGERSARPNDAAYAIYTSGSTGKPKGLEVSHYNLLRLHDEWAEEAFGLPDRQAADTAVVAPFVFDMSAAMIFFSLLRGERLHLVSDASKRSGRELVEYLNRHAIDLVDATPNYLRLIDEHLALHPEQELCVRRIFCIGDVLSDSLARRLIRRANAEDFRLYNTYGPAECTVLVTSAWLDKAGAASGEALTIGRAVGFAALEAAREDGSRCADGEAGELLIRGDCVGLGYIGSPQGGADGPFFVSESGVRGYRTGDLVRRLEDGRYVFVGRKDRQRKINGYRVELEEIERAAERLDGVREARAVVSRDGTSFAGIGLCYIGERDYAPQDMIGKLRAALPHYMVPQRVCRCAELPVTFNGKVDYAALLDLLRCAREMPAEIGAYAEAAIGRLLGTDRFDRKRSLFELGGSSITLLALAGELHGAFGLGAGLARLYEAGSVEHLIAALRQDHAAAEASLGASPAEEGPQGLELPVTEPQKKLLAQEQRLLRGGADERERQRFSLLLRLTLLRPVDRPRLERAVNEALASRDVFRLRLLRRQGRNLMRAEPEYRPIALGDKPSGTRLEDALAVWPAGVPVRPGEELPPFEPLIELLLEEPAQSDAEAPPASAYGFAPELLPGAPEATRGSRAAAPAGHLYLHVKHAILDYLSLQFLLQDILTVYEGSGPLPERGSFAASAMRSGGEEHEAYWRERLRNRPPLTRLIPDQDGERGFAAIALSANPETVRLLRSRAAKLSVSPFVWLLTLFLRTVSQYSGRSDLRIGCYFPGRAIGEEERALGMFTRVLPLMLHADEHESADRLARRAADEVSGILRHQAIMPGRLYRLLPLEQAAEGELFEVCFNYQNGWPAMPGQGDWFGAVETLNRDPDITERDFYFGVIEENEGMRWEIKFNRGLYSEPLVREFAASLERRIVEEACGPSFAETIAAASRGRGIAHD